MGLGNTIFGINLTQKGAWGPVFTGPAGFIVLFLYRLYTFFKVKCSTGHWIDKKDSNFYDPDTDKFRCKSLVPLTFMWFPPIIALIIVTYAFKFAKESGINQGVIPCLFSLTTVYTVIIFYFKFDEKISALKGLGMIIMSFCVVFLCLEVS
jgi:Ca2+/Na+ antiporter